MCVCVLLCLHFVSFLLIHVSWKQIMWIKNPPITIVTQWA